MQPSPARGEARTVLHNSGCSQTLWAQLLIFHRASKLSLTCSAPSPGLGAEHQAWVTCWVCSRHSPSPPVRWVASTSKNPLWLRQVDLDLMINRIQFFTAFGVYLERVLEGGVQSAVASSAGTRMHTKSITQIQKSPSRDWPKDGPQVPGSGAQGSSRNFTLSFHNPQNRCVNFCWSHHLLGVFGTK